MTADRISDHTFRDRVRSVLSILLFAGCVGMGAAAVIRFQQNEPIAGWTFAIGALATVLGTAQYVGRVLPGILCLAAINSFSMSVSGHKLNQADTPVPRIESGIAAVLFVTAAAFSTRFLKSRTTYPDRLAILGSAISLMVGATKDSYFLPAAVGIFCCTGLARLASAAGSMLQRSASRERPGGDREC